MSNAQSSRIAIVTVHGTGDTAEGSTGQKWFQKGSAFSERLLRRLAGHGLEAEVLPHLWSGANLVSEREKGAERLVRTIERCAKSYAGVHVIGHSHGGNVANDAAVLMRWGRRRPDKESLASIVTVGTPFLDTRTGFLQMLGGLAFRGITWGSVLAFPLTVLGGILLAFSAEERAAAAAEGELSPWVVVLIVIALIAPSLWFMLRIARRGVRRILRPRDKTKQKRSLLALWHENDEAIAFLQRVEELPIEAFPRGSLYRNSRMAAVSWGVIGTLVVALAAPLSYALGVDILALEAAFLEPDARGKTIENSVTISIIAFLLAPLVFVLVFLVYRYVIGGLSEIGARGTLNRWITGVLRGIALGRDGDQAPCNTSTTSHTHPCDTHVLSGDVAQRMQAGASDAASRLIEKYRWALFRVGSDTNQSLASLATDAMTWDSLIHTTYFDQPEVADLIGDYIAAQAKGQPFAAPSAAAAPNPLPDPPPEDAPRAA